MKTQILFSSLIVLILLSFQLNAQSISGNDLFTVGKSEDIKLANDFLTNYKEFTFIGSLGKTSEGCTTFKWTKGKEEIEITSGNIYYEGKNNKVFTVKYLFPIEAADSYQSALTALGFGIRKSGVTKFGEPFSIWSGSETRLEDMMKIFSFTKKGSFCEVAIIST